MLHWKFISRSETTLNVAMKMIEWRKHCVNSTPLFMDCNNGDLFEKAGIVRRPSKKDYTDTYAYYVTGAIRQSVGRIGLFSEP